MTQRVNDKLILALMIITIMTIISVGISVNRELHNFRQYTTEEMTGCKT